MRFDKLADWLAWQEQLHPVAIELGLERVRAVFSRLCQSPLPFVVVTVAGTNGKGSSVAVLEAVLMAAGYRVGAYTSPHLLRYNERIRLAGQMVSDDELCRAFARVDQARDDISLTYFEFGTLAALEIFVRFTPDIVLLEVGMGGRLDAVNVIDPDVSLVTAIGLDHRDWLGADREAIGREKAGIFRAGRPAICSDPRPPRSVGARARSVGARWYLAGRDYDYSVDGRATEALPVPPRAPSLAASWSWQGGGQRLLALPIPGLVGEFQLQNAAGALMVLACLRDSFRIERRAISQGLCDVRLPGRFQWLPGNISCLLDVAHNRESAAVLAATLAAVPCRGKTHAVVAMLQDKDIVGVLLEMQGVVDEWYPASLPGERAAPVDRLLKLLESQLHCCPVASRGGDVRGAYQAAVSRAGSEDRIVVFGSFGTVAEVIRYRDAHG